MSGSQASAVVTNDKAHGRIEGCWHYCRCPRCTAAKRRYYLDLALLERAVAVQPAQAAAT